MEHQGKLLWKQGYDCTISKKQRNQYHSISPDPLSCKQAIRRANYQSYYWLHCNDKIVSQLSLTCYRWNYNEQLNMAVSVWFDWPQFLPSIIKKKKNQRTRQQSMVIKQTFKILKIFYHQPPKSPGFN